MGKCCYFNAISICDPSTQHEYYVTIFTRKSEVNIIFIPSYSIFKTVKSSYLKLIIMSRWDNNEFSPDLLNIIHFNVRSLLPKITLLINIFISLVSMKHGWMILLVTKVFQVLRSSGKTEIVKAVVQSSILKIN